MKRFQFAILLSAIMALLTTGCIDTVGEQLRHSLDESDYITFEAICNWSKVSQDAKGDDVAATRADGAFEGGSKLIDVIPIAIEGEADSLCIYVYEEDMAAGVTAWHDIYAEEAETVDREEAQAIPTVEYLDSLYKSRSEATAASRGTEVSTAADIKTYSLTGYKFPAAQEWGDDCLPNFIYNEERKNSWDVWANSNVLEWPGSDYKVRFFASYPANVVPYPPADRGGTPTFTYTIPKDVKNQIDILTADTGVLTGERRKTVQLKFDHALAAIEFFADASLISGTYNYFKIDSVYRTGTYNFADNSWSDIKDKSSIEETRVTALRGANKAINTGDRAMFAIPQTLGADASMSLSFCDSLLTNNASNARKVTVPITGEWRVGKKYRYVLAATTKTYTPSMSEMSRTNAPMAGGTGTIKLKSYVSTREKANGGVSLGTHATSAWFGDLRVYNPETGKYDISYDYKKLPSGFWIKKVTVSSVNSSGEFTVTYQTEANNEVTSNATTKAVALQNTAAKGSAASPWNLANSTGAATNENTANCYIVNGPGTYSLPLVYGNALKNGVYNSTYNNGSTLNCTWDHLHYGDSVCTYRMMHPYPLGGSVTANKDYALVQVTKPYIYDFAPEGMAATEYIDGVRLVWQDSPGLIQNLRLSTDHKNIVFDVPASTIRQGNALISVTADGQVLWSWHIWVTDYVLSSTNVLTIQNYTNYDRNILPLNLGWIDETSGVQSRSARLYIYQGKTGKTWYTELTQNGATELNEDGYSPIWQWGCPIPRMRPDKPYCDINGKSVPFIAVDLATGFNSTDFMVNMLCNPGVFISGTNYGSEIMNAWNWRANLRTITVNTITKSMYDPCPYGTAVPNSGLFTGFSISGATVTSYTSVENFLEQINVSDKVFGPAGSFNFAHFYLKPNKKGNTSSFPLFSTAVSGTKSYNGLYWTCTPSNFGTGSWCLNILPYNSAGENGRLGIPGSDNSSYYRSCGGLIRPMYGNHN